MGWFVLHVGPRTEKKVAAVCARYGIPHYLPLHESVKIYQRRKVVVHKPLFPGYLFAALSSATRVYVLRTNHVFRMITPDHEAKLLHELEQVRLALSVDPRLGPSGQFSLGTRVRITAGVFQGLEGHVGQLTKRATVRLNVELVGQSIGVDVDRDLLEILP